MMIPHTAAQYLRRLAKGWPIVAVTWPSVRCGVSFSSGGGQYVRSHVSILPWDWIGALLTLPVDLTYNGFGAKGKLLYG